MRRMLNTITAKFLGGLIFLLPIALTVYVMYYVSRVIYKRLGPVKLNHSQRTEASFR